MAVASVGGALIGSNASKDAAKTQAEAATQSGQYQLQAAQLAAQLQLGMFNTIRGDLSPYRGVGTAALPGYYKLLGLPMPSSVPTTTTTQNTGLAPGGALNIPGIGSGASVDNFGGGAPGTLSGGVSAFTGGAAPGGGGAYYDASGNLVLPGVNGAPAAAAPSMRAGDVNYDQLFKDRPDVMQEYQRLSSTADRNSPWFSQHGLDSPQSFASWWLQNKPAGDNYQAPTWTQQQIDGLNPAPTSGGAQGTGAGAGTGAAQPGGANGPSLTGEAGTGTGDIQSYLETLPGYQFTKDQGIRAVTNALSAKGLGGISGPMAKGIARFVTGLADQTYSEQVARMGSAVGVGQSAANQTGAYGSTAASGAGSSLIGGAGAAGSGMVGAANAIAAGQVGSANAIAGGVNGAANAYLTSKILGMYGSGTH